MPKRKRMTVDYKIIQAKDFIKATPTGEVDLKESKKVLGQIAEMLGLVGTYELLVDVREAHSDMQQPELTELVAELVRHKEVLQNKIAILARNGEQFNKAVFVEICANIDGLTVEAFSDYEKAINWIQSEDYLENL
jgi:hypothetical protein